MRHTQRSEESYWFVLCISALCCFRGGCSCVAHLRVCCCSVMLQIQVQAPKLSLKGSAWPSDLMLFFLESQNGHKERGAEEEPALLLLCASGKSGTQF